MSRYTGALGARQSRRSDRGSKSSTISRWGTASTRRTTTGSVYSSLHPGMTTEAFATPFRTPAAAPVRFPRPVFQTLLLRRRRQRGSRRAKKGLNSGPVPRISGTPFPIVLLGPKLGLRQVHLH